MHNNQPQDSGGDLSGPPNKRAKVDNRDIADKVRIFFCARINKYSLSFAQPPTDFFGRIISVASISSTKAAARKNIEKKYRVTYRYTEGNSAAVRKPVKFGAFL